MCKNLYHLINKSNIYKSIIFHLIVKTGYEILLIIIQDPCIRHTTLVHFTMI